jgi:GNAT superfamily N-acetyltransferase
MSTVTVEAVLSRRQRKAFLQLPWQLYRDEPLWVPPLRHEEVGLVGYGRHPFYENAESETFLAIRDGEVCGRVAAIDNRAHSEYQGEKRGFFGFFECRDDPDAAAALLGAARQWLAERDLHDVRGPANPSLNYTIGTLVEGFDVPPGFMLPYNLPYYGKLIEGCGYRKTQDLYAYQGNTDKLPELVAKRASVIDQMIERHGITFRWMERKHLRENVREFLTIFNQSLTDHWGFVPISTAEVDEMSRGLSWLLVPDMAVGAEIDGRLVGVCFILPDYNPRLRKIRGRLFPFGFLRLILGKHRIKRCRIVAANVLPEYRLLGVGVAMIQALRLRWQDSGIQEAEFSWVAESNLLSRGTLEKMGAERTKTYRVYDLDR